MTEQRFYYDGIFYDTEDAFMKAVDNFANSTISQESTERILRHMCKEISMNLLHPSVNYPLLTNAALKGICSTMMIEFIGIARQIERETQQSQDPEFKKGVLDAINEKLIFNKETGDFEEREADPL